MCIRVIHPLSIADFRLNLYFEHKRRLTICVEYDGKGFDISILKTNKGIGWRNIRNRVDFLKGKLDIRSKDGEGTSVQIEVNG